jgi:hypothetical protein
MVAILPVFLPLPSCFYLMSHPDSPKHTGALNHSEGLWEGILKCKADKDSKVCSQTGTQWFLHFSESTKWVSVLAPGRGTSGETPHAMVWAGCVPQRFIAGGWNSDVMVWRGSGTLRR